MSSPEEPLEFFVLAHRHVSVVFSHDECYSIIYALIACLNIIRNDIEIHRIYSKYSDSHACGQMYWER